MKKVMKDIFQKLMFNILKKLHELYNDLPFLPERMKMEKVEKLVANLHDKSEYVTHIGNLQQALTRRNYLVSEPNYHTTKFFTENLLATEMKKKKKQKYL